MREVTRYLLLRAWVEQPCTSICNNSCALGSCGCPGWFALQVRLNAVLPVKIVKNVNNALPDSMNILVLPCIPRVTGPLRNILRVMQEPDVEPAVQVPENKFWVFSQQVAQVVKHAEMIACSGYLWNRCIVNPYIMIG